MNDPEPKHSPLCQCENCNADSSEPDERVRAAVANWPCQPGDDMRSLLAFHASVTTPEPPDLDPLQQAQCELAQMTDYVRKLERERVDFRATLHAIATLWPEGTSCVICDVSGINDGKARAVLLEGAVNMARKALGMELTPKGDR